MYIIYTEWNKTSETWSYFCLLNMECDLKTTGHRPHYEGIFPLSKDGFTAISFWSWADGAYKYVKLNNKENVSQS